MSSQGCRLDNSTLESQLVDLRSTFSIWAQAYLRWIVLTHWQLQLRLSSNVCHTEGALQPHGGQVTGVVGRGLGEH